MSSTKRPPLVGMCGALALLASCSSTPAPSASSAGGTAGTSSAGQGGAGATGGTAATGGAGLAGNAGSSTGGTDAGGAGGLAGNAGSSTGGAGAGGAGGLAGSAGSSTGGAGASGADGGPSTCAKPYASGRRSLTLVVAGTTRRFLLYVPKGYVGTTPLPLVFNLHPTGTSPESNEDSTRMETFADQRGFMVVALEGINRVWNVALDPSRPSDVAFAEAVLDFANTNLCIDNGRVYSTGMSGGARMSSRFACALGKRIAAIAPVAGLRNDPPCQVSGIDVLTIHGTKDATNFYNGCPQADTACSRNGEWVESVENAVGDWVSANGCAATPVIDDLGGGVTRRSYLTCTTGSVVVFYRVEGGTHDWYQLPDTTKIVVDFLLSH